MAIVAVVVAVTLVLLYRARPAPGTNAPRTIAAAPRIDASLAPGRPFPGFDTPGPEGCDAGAGTLNADDAAITARHAAGARVLETIAADLAGHASATDRAMSELVLFVIALYRAHAALARQDPSCVQDVDCAQRQDAAVLQASGPHLDAIARIAVQGNDPGAYELALLACHFGNGTSTLGACAQLSALQWAQLEPQNAQPWLMVAAEAARQSQDAPMAEALFRASQAPRNEAHWELFARLLEAPALANAGADTRNEVAFTAMSLTAGTQFAPFGPIFAYCPAAALEDPNRRQVCDDLARLLTERSDTLVSMAVGTALGARLGWAPARLQQQRDWRDAELQLDTEPAGSDALLCASLERLRARFGEAVTLGEVNALRRRVAASGWSPAQLAQQRRAAIAAGEKPLQTAPAAP